MGFQTNIPATTQWQLSSRDPTGYRMPCRKTEKCPKALWRQKALEPTMSKADNRSWPNGKQNQLKSKSKTNQTVQAHICKQQKTSFFLKKLQKNKRKSRKKTSSSSSNLPKMQHSCMCRIQDAYQLNKMQVASELSEHTQQKPTCNYS